LDVSEVAGKLRRWHKHSFVHPQFYKWLRKSPQKEAMGLLTTSRAVSRCLLKKALAYTSVVDPHWFQ
jgi:hypothetical protein